MGDSPLPVPNFLQPNVIKSPTHEFAQTKWLFQSNQSNHGFREIPNEYFDATHTFELIFAKNAITFLSPRIRNLRLLTCLDLSHNRLIFLPTEITSLPSLSILLLRCNQLHTLPADMQNLKTLRILDISANRFEELPRSLCCLGWLKALMLSENSIEHLPMDICNMRNLHLLDLRYNRLVHLPKTLILLDNLESLLLDGNPLQFPSLSVIRRGLVHLMAFLLRPSRLNKHQQPEFFDCYDRSAEYLFSNPSQSHRSSTTRSSFKLIKRQNVTTPNRDGFHKKSLSQDSVYANSIGTEHVDRPYTHSLSSITLKNPNNDAASSMDGYTSDESGPTVAHRGWEISYRTKKSSRRKNAKNILPTTISPCSVTSISTSTSNGTRLFKTAQSTIPDQYNSGSSQILKNYYARPAFRWDGGIMHTTDPDASFLVSSPKSQESIVQCTPDTMKSVCIVKSPRYSCPRVTGFDRCQRYRKASIGVKKMPVCASFEPSASPLAEERALPIPDSSNVSSALRMSVDSAIRPVQESGEQWSTEYPATSSTASINHSGTEPDRQECIFDVSTENIPPSGHLTSFPLKRKQSVTSDAIHMEFDAIIPKTTHSYSLPNSSRLFPSTEIAQIPSSDGPATQPHVGKLCTNVSTPNTQSADSERETARASREHKPMQQSTQRRPSPVPCDIQLRSNVQRLSGIQPPKRITGHYSSPPEHSFDQDAGRIPSNRLISGFVLSPFRSDTSQVMVRGNRNRVWKDRPTSELVLSHAANSSVAVVTPNDSRSIWDRIESEDLEKIHRLCHILKIDSNLPLSELAQYLRSGTKLIDWLNSFLTPSPNLKFSAAVEPSTTHTKPHKSINSEIQFRQNWYRIRETLSRQGMPNDQLFTLQSVVAMNGPKCLLKVANSIIHLHRRVTRMNDQKILP